jgi:hypothetical protein
VSVIAQLKKEHNDTLAEQMFSTTQQSQQVLSTIVSPSILKLTDEKDKTGMHLLGPFFGTSSPQSYVFRPCSPYVCLNKIYALNNILTLRHLLWLLSRTLTAPKYGSFKNAIFSNPFFRTLTVMLYSYIIYSMDPVVD